MAERGAAFLAALLSLGVGTAVAEGAPASAPAPFVWRQQPNTVFAVGESIVYAIKYGIVPAGTARLDVRPEESINGRSAYRLECVARSNAAMDAVFKVRDRNQSWMDRESLCSLRFRQDMREGLFKRKVETAYDPTTGRFLYRKWRKGKEFVYDGPSPTYMQDVLSSLYFIRTRDLVVGESVLVDANSGSNNWTLRVGVVARETVEVPAGRFVCLKLEPVLAGDGLFRSKGRLEVWVTDDARRVPVLLRSRVTVGAFDAEMTEYTPGGGEVPTIAGATSVQTLRP